MCAVSFFDGVLSVKTSPLVCFVVRVDRGKTADTRRKDISRCCGLQALGCSDIT